MENTPLGIVLAKVKAQLGYSASGSNQAEDQRFYVLISDMQQWLADRWNFATLEQFWDVAAYPGGRYLPIPTVESQDTATQAPLAFNKRRPVAVWRWWSADWNQIEYGIDESEFNYINSDQGQQNDPIQKWRYSDTTQIEVWPIPATTQIIRFRGQRVLNSLFTNNAPDPTLTLDLDDNLVTLWVVANHLIQSENPLGKQKMAEAMEQLSFIRSSEPRREETYVMGGDRLKDPVKLASIQIIATHG